MEPAALRTILAPQDTVTRLRWLALLALGSCHPAPVPAPAPLLLGEFEDDYGSRYAISGELWVHGTKAKYHIVRWYPEQQYLIARNDAANPSEPSRWSRIDWMPLSGMPPYLWGFCMTAYAAGSAVEAEAATSARRETPRTGCNGFPFSRMKRRS
jgi:hypothetical protein